MGKWIKRSIFYAAVVVLLSASAIAADLSVGTVKTESTLNFRSEPSTDASVTANLNNGTLIAVFGKQDGWYKAAYAGKTGYVSADYVTLSDSADFEIGTGRVAGSVVNLRKTPSTDAAVVDKLAEGATVSIVGIQDGWFKVSYKSTGGYMHPDYVEISAAVSKSTTSIDSAGIPRTGTPPDEAADSPVLGSSSSEKAKEIIDYAKTFIGVKYKAGGSSPSTGFDCSGFTQYVFKEFNIKLNRTSSGQLSNCTQIKKSELQMGDLVFFSKPGSSKIAHVGIYVSDGNFIHSPSPGGSVLIETMESGYYLKYFVAAGRVL